MLREAGGDGDENFVLSPLGMTIVTALMANGLDGSSREAFERACGMTPGKSKLYNHAMAAALTAIEEEPGNPASVANAAWMIWPLPVRPDYQALVERPYRAKVWNLGSAGRESVNQVNAWCRRQTDGRIPQLTERLDPRTSVIFTNALSLSYEWKRPFGPAKPAPFRFADGERPVPTLSEVRPFLYAEQEGVRAAWVPTKAGSIAFLLPPEDEGWPSLARRLENGLLERLRGLRRERHARIAFPRHVARSRTDLMPALRRLVGDKAVAELDLRFVSHELVQGQFVAAAEQLASFELDDHGARGAAATSVGTVASAGDPDLDFIADRPFLVVAEAPRPGLVLLAAWVARPQVQ
jgi:serine protease inhibitor